MANAQEVIAQAVTAIAQQMEANLDKELNKLDNLDDTELDKIRQQRVQDMRKRQEKSKEWLAKGHGEYDEVATEQDFFKVMKVRGGAPRVAAPTGRPRAAAPEHCSASVPHAHAASTLRATHGCVGRGARDLPLLPRELALQGARTGIIK